MQFISNIDTAEFQEGYQAQMQGKDMVKDNPYDCGDNKHWEWRKGFIQAFMDSH